VLFSITKKFTHFVSFAIVDLLIKYMPCYVQLLQISKKTKNDDKLTNFQYILTKENRIEKDLLWNFSNFCNDIFLWLLSG